MVILWQQTFFGNPFYAKHGLATGIILAPLFYKVVTDVVLQWWYLDGKAMGMTMQGCFYMDDGELCDPNPENLQMALAAMEGHFLQIGLHINGGTTKALTTLPMVATTTTIGTPTYKCCMEGVGNTYWVQSDSIPSALYAIWQCR